MATVEFTQEDYDYLKTWVEERDMNLVGFLKVAAVTEMERISELPRPTWTPGMLEHFQTLTEHLPMGRRKRIQKVANDRGRLIGAECMTVSILQDALFAVTKGD